MLGTTKGKLNKGKDASWWKDDVKQKLNKKKTNSKKWQETAAIHDKDAYIAAKKIAKQSVAIAKASTQDSQLCHT